MVDLFGNPFVDQAREVQNAMHSVDKGAHILHLSEQEQKDMQGGLSEEEEVFFLL